MKASKILLYIALLVYGTKVFANNVITLSSVRGNAGEEVVVGICLSNSSQVSSLQLNIPLGDNISYVEGSGQLTSRCGSHSLKMAVKDDILNVVIYSISMASFTGTNGNLATFKLKLGNQPDDISLTPSMSLLADANGDNVSHNTESATVTVINAKAQYSITLINFGKVPIRNSSVDFSDESLFSAVNTFPITIKPNSAINLNIKCSPLEVGSIEETMTVNCNGSSLQNTIKLAAQAYCVNELRVQPVSGFTDEEVIISLTMNNMDAINGFQMEFKMPSSLQYIDGSFILSARKQDHQISASLADGTLRAIAYSNSNKPFIGNDGEVASFRVKLVGRDNVYLNPSKVVLSTTVNNSSQDVSSGYNGATISIKSPLMYTESSLDLGNVSITESCEVPFVINNRGSAPLTINRIVFDDTNLSVKETLPLVIQANQNATVTVSHNGEKDGKITSVMKIYTNDPDQRLKEVNVTGSRFSPNYLMAQVTNSHIGENLAIDISLNNYNKIEGLQFDVVYPGEYYTTFDNNYMLGARAEGMSFNINQVDENTLRVFCYFMSCGCVAAGEGKIATIQLAPVNSDIPEGDYVVSLKNIVLGADELSNKYAGKDIENTFHVSKDNYMLGDANQDKIVSIGDIIAVVNIIAGKVSGYDLTAADANKDGKVSIGDIITIVNMIAGNH